MKFQDSSFNGLKVTVGTKSVTHPRTHPRTHAPKAICPINFFKVGGITSQQSLVKFCLLVLKILSGNEILTSIKGRNSVANLRNLKLYNPNQDIINVNVYTKFG